MRSPGSTAPTAVRHLFTVAAGLDSQILGETEILGQVRRAYDAARAAGTTTGSSTPSSPARWTTGRRVRQETMLGRHPASVSSAAVDRGGSGGRTDSPAGAVVVLGAGEAAEGVLRALHLPAPRAWRWSIGIRSVPRRWQRRGAPRRWLGATARAAAGSGRVVRGHGGGPAGGLRRRAGGSEAARGRPPAHGARPVGASERGARGPRGARRPALRPGRSAAAPLPGRGRAVRRPPRGASGCSTRRSPGWT